MDSESTPRSLINSPQHISNSRANCFISCSYLKERKRELVYEEKNGNKKPRGNCKAARNCRF